MLSGILANIDQYAPMALTGLVSAIAFGWRVERKLDIFIAKVDAESRHRETFYEAEHLRINARIKALEERIYK